MVSGRALSDRQHGAALFADISGFTQLTESARPQAWRPSAEAETLTIYLNLVYDAVV